jgi:hypothetical protein
VRFKKGQVCTDCYNQIYAERNNSVQQKSTKPLKEWNELGHSQKNVRKRKSLNYLDENKMPLEHLKKRKISKNKSVTKPTTVRKSIRELDPASLYSEPTLCKHKITISKSHATETKFFFFKHAYSTVDSRLNTVSIHSVAGSYITDPLKDIEIVTTYSKFVIVGADCGADKTKLGITYLDRNGVTRFDPILIVNQKDSYEAFNYFNTNSTLQFNGESSGFGSIYAALQHFIDTHKNKIYFNGDWNSMSALLGLNTAAAYYPCMICTIHKDNIDSLTAHSKRKECVIGEYSQVSPPLLTICNRVTMYMSMKVSTIP